MVRVVNVRSILYMNNVGKVITEGHGYKLRSETTPLASTRMTPCILSPELVGRILLGVKHSRKLFQKVTL